VAGGGEALSPGIAQNCGLYRLYRNSATIAARVVQQW
jgi:hypothetical protein